MGCVGGPGAVEGQWTGHVAHVLPVEALVRSDESASPMSNSNSAEKGSAPIPHLENLSMPHLHVLQAT